MKDLSENKKKAIGIFLLILLLITSLNLLGVILQLEATLADPPDWNSTNYIFYRLERQEYIKLLCIQLSMVLPILISGIMFFKETCKRNFIFLLASFVLFHAVLHYIDEYYFIFKPLA